jgi:hypothetical protein
VQASADQRSNVCGRGRARHDSGHGKSEKIGNGDVVAQTVRLARDA